MLNPILRNRGRNVLVYSTSPSFRVVFLVAGVIVTLAVLSASSGPLYLRMNLTSMIIIFICLATALFVERSVFDKNANRFEKHLGMLFLYARTKVELDSLRRVVVYVVGSHNQEGMTSPRARRRLVAVLSVVDAGSREYRLDTVRGSAVQQLQQTAERLSDFCGIPLEYRDSPTKDA